jgi:uncharacterized small protein (DUF1192 family)
MKTLILLIIPILFIGCGVQKSEHEKVLIENEQLIEALEVLSVENEKLSNNIELLLYELEQLNNELNQIIKNRTVDH